MTDGIINHASGPTSRTFLPSLIFGTDLIGIVVVLTSGLVEAARARSDEAKQ